MEVMLCQMGPVVQASRHTLHTRGQVPAISDADIWSRVEVNCNDGPSNASQARMQALHLRWSDQTYGSWTLIQTMEATLASIGGSAGLAWTSQASL